MVKYIVISLLLVCTIFAGSIKNNIMTTNHCDRIIERTGYTVCYNYNYKGPLYVMYDLDNQVDEINLDPDLNFKVDWGIPREYRASQSDYSNSGYDIGHLASDASFDHDISMLIETYILSNAVPMHPVVNQSVNLWYGSELKERELATTLNKVTVVNIIEYIDYPPRIGKNAIAVPHVVNKVIMKSGMDNEYLSCYSFKNDGRHGSKNILENYEVNCNKFDYIRDTR